MTAIAIGQSQCRQPGGGGGADGLGLSPGGGGVAWCGRCARQQRSLWGHWSAHLGRMVRKR
jgi:hypothetical protein